MTLAGGEHVGIVKVTGDANPTALRDLLLSPSVEALAIARPPLSELPYRELVAALLSLPGVKVDFRGQPPRNVLAMAADQLIGKDMFAAEQEMLAEEIASLETLVRDMVGTDRPPQTAIRTYFAPGDLVWHLDRVNERIAFRLLWPIGRPAGMSVTPADNIDQRRYLAHMRHEHPLLCQLDTNVLRTGAPVEQLWAHRPRELEMMKSGDFPFILDPERVWQFDPNAITIHRVDTPGSPGTYHRSSWANRQSPGLQIVITAAAD